MVTLSLPATPNGDFSVGHAHASFVFRLIRIAQFGRPTTTNQNYSSSSASDILCRNRIDLLESIYQ